MRELKIAVMADIHLDIAKDGEKRLDEFLRVAKEDGVSTGDDCERVSSVSKEEGASADDDCVRVSSVSEFSARGINSI